MFWKTFAKSLPLGIGLVMCMFSMVYCIESVDSSEVILPSILGVLGVAVLIPSIDNLSNRR